MQAKIFAATLATVFLTVSTYVAPVAAIPSKVGNYQQSEGSNEKDGHSKGNHFRQRWVEFEQDPLKMLNNKKDMVQTLLKEGKMSKDEADEIIKRVDKSIKTVNDFNKLTLVKKKEFLLKQFDSTMDARLKDGKIKKDLVEELKKEYRDRITQWDGKGYPGFLIKGVFYKGMHKHDGISPKGKPDNQLNQEQQEKQ